LSLCDVGLLEKCFCGADLQISNIAPGLELLPIFNKGVLDFYCDLIRTDISLPLPALVKKEMELINIAVLEHEHNFDFRDIQKHFKYIHAIYRDNVTKFGVHLNLFFFVIFGPNIKPNKKFDWDYPIHFPNFDLFHHNIYLRVDNEQEFFDQLDNKLRLNIKGTHVDLLKLCFLPKSDIFSAERLDKTLYYALSN
jgi:hypothetical protein